MKRHVRFSMISKGVAYLHIEPKEGTRAVVPMCWSITEPGGRTLTVQGLMEGLTQ